MLSLIRTRGWFGEEVFSLCIHKPNVVTNQILFRVPDVLRDQVAMRVLFMGADTIQGKTVLVILSTVQIVFHIKG